MFKSPLKLIALALSVASILTACGGGGSGGSAAGGGNGEGSTPPPSVSGRTIVTPQTGRALDTILIERSTAVNITSTGGENPTVTVAEQLDSPNPVTNNSGVVGVSFHSISYNFPSTTANADNDGYFSNSDNHRIRFADTGTGYLRTIASVNELIDGTGSLDGTFYRLNPAFNPAGTIGGFGTAGMLTPANIISMATAASVIYTSRLDIDIYQTNSTMAMTAPSRSIRVASFPLTANFATNRISGSATLSGGGRITISQSSGNFILNEAGGGFDGALTVDSGAETTLGINTGSFTGSYAGHFFGAGAEDIAGVIRFDAEDASGDLLGIGGFRGDRPSGSNVLMPPPPPPATHSTVVTPLPSPSLANAAAVNITRTGTVSTGQTVTVAENAPSAAAVTFPASTISVAFGGSNYVFNANASGSNNYFGATNGNQLRIADETGYITTLADAEDVLDQSHADVQGTFYRMTPTFAAAGNVRGYGTMGMLTDTSFFQNLVSEARYTGRLEIDVYQANSTTAITAVPTTRTSTAMTLTINFNQANSMISGSATYGSGAVTFNATAVTESVNGGGFSGSLGFDTPALTALGITTSGVVTGSYEGDFFGANAEDVAGVIRFNTTRTGGGNVLGIGGFRGDKPELGDGNGL